MITINNLNLSFGGQKLFENANLQISAQEKIGLVGRNGHGKTTLLSLICGNLGADAGDIIIPRNYRIGNLPQYIKFSTDSVIAEARLGLDSSNDWQAEKMLYGLGFTSEQIAMSPQNLSGGFQIRLNLAKLLLSQPDLLLLDEPTNYLDIVALRWLTGFLRSWPGELLLITHDRGFMDSVVSHVAGIHRLQIRKIAGSTDKYYEQIAQDEDIYERTRINEGKKRAEVEQWIKRFRYKANLATRVQSRVKALQRQDQKAKLEKISDPEFVFNYQEIISRQLLSVDNLSFSYDGQTDIVKNLSFAVTPGERVAIIGRNGQGKSTLLNLLAGDLTPTGGVINYHNKALCAWYGQTNIDRLQVEHTVEQAMRDSSSALPTNVRNICGAMNFSGDAALKLVKVLSGGERARVLMGRLLLNASNILLLDEPTNHLDIYANDNLLEALAVYEGAIILVTHNEMFLRALADRLIVLDQGTVRMFSGSYDEFLASGGFAEMKPMSAGIAIGNKVSNDSRRIERQQRALLVQKRSQQLRPLKQQYEQCENKLIEQEERLSDVWQELAVAAAADSGEIVIALTMESKQLQESIEKKYQLLEDLERQIQQIESAQQ